MSDNSSPADLVSWLQRIPPSDYCKELIHLNRNIDHLEQLIEEAKAKIKSLEPAIMSQMEQMGTTSLNVDGYNIHTRRDVFAQCLDAAALEGFAETRFLVRPTVNTNSLKAWVREQENPENGEIVLPPQVRDAIKVSTVIRLATKKKG